MFRSLLVLSLAVLLAGCAADPQASAASANAKVPVVKLTEFDGCTVYRFHDAGHYRYVAKCEQAVPATVSTQVSCGKHCTRPDGLLVVSDPQR